MLSIIQAAGWPIWPLILCSVVGLALVIERFISLKTSVVAPPTLLDEAITVSQRGLPPGDVIEQLSQNSALGEVLAEGFREVLRNPRGSDEALRAAEAWCVENAFELIEVASCSSCCSSSKRKDGSVLKTNPRVSGLFFLLMVVSLVL